MCDYPRLIKNKKFEANKKNGGVVPAVRDGRTKWVAVGCQNCRSCKRKKGREWQIRLLEEVKGRGGGKFVTLTFSNESIMELKEKVEFEARKIRLEAMFCKGKGREREKLLEKARKMEMGYGLDNAIAKMGVRMFLERWRKKYKKSLRHWFVTELGHNGTENIHLHGIIWGGEVDEIRKYWKYGYIWPRHKRDEKKMFVTERTVNYVIKYVTKIDKEHRYFKGKVLCSGGIGESYIKTYNARLNGFRGKDTVEYMTTRTGHKMAMPIYYRNKIYNDREREDLWINRLDKGIIWVGGVKIEVRNGLEKYYRAIKEEQRKGVEQGYRGWEIDWDVLEYEESRRKMMMEKRSLPPVNPLATKGGGLEREEEEGGMYIER